ncbi:MAG: type II 3-dehydroquinate dehydratase [SAR86 cluster bacterium]|jgi:3-dehydroquinate dehydratase II|nr:type II 3-dehydroquinate dehydratase [SAR86 cluster bacterium]
MSNFLLLNGPNLNLLGTREPEIYGKETLDDIENVLCSIANNSGQTIESFQSNAEHELVDKIQAAKLKNIACIIFNPGALTHTSIALRDAFLGTAIPFIEVHISNIYSREDFRKESFLSDISIGIISGLGTKGYELALEAAITKYGNN